MLTCTYLCVLSTDCEYEERHIPVEAEVISNNSFKFLGGGGGSGHSGGMVERAFREVEQTNSAGSLHGDSSLANSL
jgi:hypothetical protein